ncbi:MAG: metallophosphoesterase, partial [Bacteroidales bacterium]|nr:metallophosphoesterase [Bacteroidales bacterium]
MKRRSFLKNAAWASVLLTGAPALSSCIRKEDGTGTQPTGTEPSASLPYRADGRFKVLQFTDTHYIAGDPRSERALRCVEEALDAEKPDLVIHTGDILFGKPD